MGEVRHGEYGTDMVEIHYLYIKLSKVGLPLCEQKQRRSGWEFRGEAERGKRSHGERTRRRGNCGKDVKINEKIN